MLNWVDALIVIIVFWHIWRGWRQGFLHVAADLAGLALAVMAGLQFYPPVSAWLLSQFNLPEMYGRPVGFIVVAGLVGALFGLFIASLVRRLPPAVHTHVVNRVFGIAPGAVAGALIAALAVTFLSLAPLSASVASAAQDARLAGPLVSWTVELEGRLRPVFGEAIAETMSFLTVRPDEDTYIRLPYQVAQPSPSPEVEIEMLELVNRERVAAGLRPLVMDDALRGVARAHARDMFERGYFSHYTPEQASPFDRMDRAGIRYLTAGENLALAPNVQVAHQGLMNSPGHRANILSPSFRRVGIGALNGGIRGYMFAQEFAN